MGYNDWLLKHGKLRKNPIGHVLVRFPDRCKCPYAYCERCGLMTLKNEVSRKAIKDRCPADMRAPGETEDGIVVFK